jgi:uncharacterized protein YegP (UPF0339 family)
MQCIANFPGKSYLIRNGEWIPVPVGSRLSDYPEPKVERKPVIVPVATEFKVKSSKPGKFYTVVRSGNHYSCDCQGYTYRAKCRHIEEAKKL